MHRHYGLEALLFALAFLATCGFIVAALRLVWGVAVFLAKVNGF